MSKLGFQLQDEGMFLARSPLLALDTFNAWQQAEDKRGFLRACYRQPLLQQALYLASPSLYERYQEFSTTDPTAANGHNLAQAAEEEKLDLALAKYLARAAYRCTPFGLFAAISSGKIAEHDQIPHLPQIPLRPRVRLDFGQQAKILQWLLAQDAIRHGLRYRLNGSVYLHGNKYYYVEAVAREEDKLYQLSQVERETYLDTLFAAATEFRPLPELVGILQTAADCSADEALVFLEDLIAADILQADLGISITGQESFARMCARLQGLGQENLLQAVASNLQQMPAQLIPATTQSAEQAIQASQANSMPLIAQAEQLLQTLAASTGLEFERKNLLQVDARRDCEEQPLCLAQEKVAQLSHAATCLTALTLRRNTYLDDFKKSFKERYGEHEVPLLLVFNDELGIPFPRAGNPISELLQGIDFPRFAKSQAQQIPWSGFDALLLRKYEACVRSGSDEITLSEEDLAPLLRNAQTRFEGGMHLHATLHVKPDGQVEHMYLQGFGGRTGLEMLGRFCDVDPTLQEDVERIAKKRNPDDAQTIYAEVVHLPQDRLVNIVARPHLCSHEIVCLGMSGLPEEQQIHLADLQLSLHENRFMLRSKRLNKYIIPRMSTAHNVFGRNLSLYQFLSVLSQQDQAHHGFQWSSVFNESQFLPRVKFADVVVQLATWRLPKKAIIAFKQAVSQGEAAISAWREEYKLPRYISWDQSDNVLPVDLENKAMCAMLLGEIENLSSLTLYEALPLAWHAASGGQTLEAVLPLAAKSVPKSDASKAATGKAPKDAEKVPEKGAQLDRAVAQSYRLEEPYQYQVGGQWLYYKLYCGQAQLDELLAQHIAPFMQTMQDKGICESWFFIRYADPDFHLRLRANCPQAAQRQALSERFAELSARLCELGLFWKLEMAGYEREVRRYGGLAGLNVCERLFALDSRLVTTFLQNNAPEKQDDNPAPLPMPQRWLFSVLYVRSLLAMFFPEIEQQRRQVQIMADSYRKEFGFGARQKVQLGARYRSYRQQLDQLIFARTPDEQGLRATWLNLLAQYEAPINELVQQLLAQAKQGDLETDMSNLVGSLVHMHCNRMFASGQRAHEAVFYDFLQRIYGSIAATNSVSEQVA